MFLPGNLELLYDDMTGGESMVVEDRWSGSGVPDAYYQAILDDDADIMLWNLLQKISGKIRMISIIDYIY